jgi:lycopene beta-cyclase
MKQAGAQASSRLAWIARTVREETGVLPIVLAGNMDTLWARDPGQPRAGLRAGLFHPTTGYSLPDAVRLAEKIAAAPDVRSGPIAQLIANHSRDLWRQRGYFRLLNRMLFVAATPDERVGVLARFYGMPEPLIRRFYAAQLTFADQARIVSGKPPISIFAALQSFPASSGWRFARANETSK